MEPLWQVARHYVIIVMWQKADLDFRPHFFIYHETGNLPTLCNNYLLCSGHFVHMLPEILSLAVPLKTSASLIAIFIDEHIKVMSRSSHFFYRFWAMEDHSECWAARCRNRRKCEETESSGQRSWWEVVKGWMVRSGASGNMAKRDVKDGFQNAALGVPWWAED